MNAYDVLKYGQLTVLRTIDGLHEHAWEQPGACGVWSAKNVIAHLASFEQVLVDLLTAFVDGDPLLFQSPLNDAFNDREVDRRAQLSPAATLHELEAAHERVLALVQEIDAETLRRPGMLPWYGAEYSLDDLIVYQYYGHKREHSAQIAQFRARAGA